MCSSDLAEAQAAQLRHHDFSDCPNALEIVRATVDVYQLLQKCIRLLLVGVDIGHHGLLCRRKRLCLLSSQRQGKRWDESQEQQRRCVHFS